jgi:hypothetical protein
MIKSNAVPRVLKADYSGNFTRPENIRTLADERIALHFFGDPAAGLRKMINKPCKPAASLSCSRSCVAAP